ncbi:MAG: hypothetical protein KVP17_005120 [Porospora cf. gigantea B]|nr:MAG: hypothetical protein KVP18_001260 [Porospora cf. gigantea A]KAH0488273.1 MAG: hypothetical protein KVP17_005120 [Porospora cf. gigantea B]
MAVIEYLNQDNNFIVYRINTTNVLIKEGFEQWLQEQVKTRLNQAEKGTPKTGWWASLNKKK